MPNLKGMQSIFDHLIQDAAHAGFKGIDPYDFAETNSSLPHALLSKFSFLNKVSPFNFRSLLRIKATSNTKANGLWLWAMVKTDMAKYNDEIQLLLKWIEENKSAEFEEFSMGFSFRMALSRYASGPGKTSLIISLFIVFPLMEIYARTHDPHILEKILSFESLLENKWMKFESEHELWYSYLPGERDEVYNASAKIGRFYANLYNIHKNQRYLVIIKKVQNYLFRVQEEDGHWGYSVKARYVDSFHTAFVLESIYEMRRLVDNSNFLSMFSKGLHYYIRNCFSEGFVPLHFSRLHGTNDIRSGILGTEIRDCANAIILFSKTGKVQEASRVLKWTNDNFYNETENYYSFYKNKYFSNKINFIRWQSWMALAIAEYISISK